MRLFALSIEWTRFCFYPCPKSRCYEKPELSWDKRSMTSSIKNIGVVFFTTKQTKKAKNNAYDPWGGPSPETPGFLLSEQEALLFYNHILFWAKNNAAQSNHLFAKIWTVFLKKSIHSQKDDSQLPWGCRETASRHHGPFLKKSA